jgi:hypothetical protein
MKSYSDFIKESAKSRPVMQATRLRLTSDGHGGWYTKSGEFVAKTNGQGLKFYNQSQRFGKRDPDQVRTLRNQQVVATQNQTEEYQKELREKYISGEIFNVGEYVENINTGLVGKIIRKGTNHLICVTEDDAMFKSWIKDVVEYTEVKMDSIMRDKEHPNTLVGTLGAFKYHAKMTPGAIGTGKKNLAVGQKAYGINLINNYKKKSN